MTAKSVDEFANDCVAHSIARVHALIKSESRGRGDHLNAMRRIERKHDVPFGLMWKLLYRRPKDVFVGELVRIENAFLAAASKEEKRLETSLSITAAILGADNASSFAASAGRALIRKSVEK